MLATRLTACRLAARNTTYIYRYLGTAAAGAAGAAGAAATPATATPSSLITLSEQKFLPKPSSAAFSEASDRKSTNYRKEKSAL